MEYVNNRAYVVAAILSIVLGLLFVSGSSLEDYSHQTVKLNQKINPNTASAELLSLLEGVGPVKAEKIINYRKITGQQARAFNDANDLLNVSGIGPKTIEKIKDHLEF